jgi:hypothetical protein
MSESGRFLRRVRPWPKPPPEDSQDAVPPEDEAPRPAVGSGIVEPNMQWVRDMIPLMSAEQLTLVIALVFTQIRESGYTLSSPMESVVWGQPPAWRVLDGQRKEVGAVRFQEGEWKTR